MLLIEFENKNCVKVWVKNYDMESSRDYWEDVYELVNFVLELMLIYCK